MIGRKTLKRFIAFLAFFSISGAAAAFSYGILAAGVLVAAVAVVAAPFVGVALTAVEVAGVMGAATVHSALAAYVFGQPVKTPPNMPPVMVRMIQNAPATTAKPVKVNLSPMTTDAKNKYQNAKTAAATAAKTTPTPAQPGTGQGAAESSARSQVQPGFDYLKNYAGSSAVVSVDCKDNGISTITCNVTCDDGGRGYCNPPYKYPLGASVNYTPGKAAVNCPTGSHKNGSVCSVDKDGTQDALVNDGSSTPQWNPAGIPDDATLSADNSTLSRTTANPDGTTTTTNVTAQPDGSLDVVDSTFDPSTGKTVHDGYAVDTNGVIQSFAGAVSNGNYAGSNSGTTFPNAGTPNGSANNQGGDGGCGSSAHPDCKIDFGSPDAGPVLPEPDSAEADAAMKTTVFDSLTKFQLPAHNSYCPTMDVPTDYFRKAGTVSTKSACDFMETNRSALSSVFSLIWVIAALLIVLSA